MTDFESPFNYSDIARSVHFPSSLVFAQLGAFHRTANMSVNLAANLKQEGLTSIEFDSPRGDFVTWSRKCGTDDVGILTTLASVLSDTHCEEILMQMRPQITQARERGARVLALSSSPLQNYPSLNSSSILLDASTLSMRPLSLTDGEAIVRSHGIACENDVSQLTSHASGSRALLERFCSIHLSQESGNRKRHSAREAEHIVAIAVFEELGPSLCSWLEHRVFECDESTLNAEDIPPNVLQSLRLAGVIRPDGLTDEGLALLPVKNRVLWVEALGEVLESVISPPSEWLRLVGEIFQIERKLRLDLRGVFEARHGANWPLTIMPDREAAILALARRDTTPSVQHYADVRSPLEWLTLTELLEVAARESDTSMGRVLGHSSDEWKEFSKRVVPIRNRIAHMRLTRDGDWQTLRSLRKTLDMRVRAAAVNSAGSSTTLTN